MNLKDLTELLVKSLVKDKDSVSVKEFETDDDSVHIQVMVPESEMGAVIGKEGRVAKAIRTLVRASSYANENKKVVIEIDSF